MKRYWNIAAADGKRTTSQCLSIQPNIPSAFNNSASPFKVLSIPSKVISAVFQWKVRELYKRSFEVGASDQQVGHKINTAFSQELITKIVCNGED